ncbi:Conserved_hypothetical protein [Hexamita inflata]|uniref:Transmembrane protein n=1 Tax=Hexamita inflata TaxID=28002 RepID=A0AA86UBJ9_9EUKA|nr:Conserved hypothetical protein [Hexamita inflata]
MSACEWQLAGRIWFSAQSCTLNNALDLSKVRNPALPVSSDYAKLDASVVTAVRMSQLFNKNSQFNQLLDVGAFGVLSNGVIIVNTTFEVDPQTELLYASVFGSFQGKLDNISISGSIFINVPEINKLKTIFLSNFVGNTRRGMNVTVSNADETEFVFRNVNSAVKYFINGQQVTDKVSYLDDQYKITNVQTGVNIQMQSIFDDQVINVPNTEIDYKKLIQDSYEFYDSVQKKKFNITTWSSLKYKNSENVIDNQFINAFEDLYPNSLQLQLEKFYETQGMTVRRFNAKNEELELAGEDDTDVVLTIYQENTKAVAIRKDTRMIICEYPNLYDTVLKTCVLDTSCVQPKFIFQSTCVPACPSGFFTFNNECWIKCPLWLGASAPFSGSQCVSCPQQSLKASKQGCIPGCTQEQYQFGDGCYEFCPFGTNSVGQSCIAPSFISDCPQNQFLVLLGEANNRRFYNLCTKQEPHWLYKILDSNQISTQIYKTKCAGTVLMSKECIEDSLNLPPPTDCPIKDQSTCRQACLNITNDVNVYNQCKEQCPDYNYEQNVFGVCHSCLGEYDGGQYYHRINRNCTSICSYWSQETDQMKICEDGSQCNKYIKISETSFQCYQNCPLSHQFMNQISPGTYECIIKCYDGSYPDRFTNICNNNCLYLNLQNIDKCETPGTPQCYRIQRISGKQSIYQCQSKCKSAQYVNQSIDLITGKIISECVDECEPKYYDITGIEILCLPVCDGKYLPTQKGVCRCGDSYYMLNGQCQSSCDGNYRYDEVNHECNNACYYVIINGRKVCNQIKSSCEQMLSDGQQCVGKCPDNYFVDSMQCLSRCPTSMYFQNRTCVNSFKDCPFFIRIGDQKECYNICPQINPFSFGQECLTNCSVASLFQSGSTCTSKCSGQMQFYENKQCTDSCSSLIYMNDTKVCLSSTDECNVYIIQGNNKVCLKTCPITAQFNINQMCVEKCEKGFLNWNKTCVDSNISCNMIDNSIPGNGIFNCTKSCNFYVSSVINNQYQNECFKKCNDYSNGSLTYFIQTIKGGKCIASCEDEISGTEPFVYQYVTNQYTFKQCLVSCSNITQLTLYIENGFPYNNCVQKCKENSTVSVKDMMCQQRDCTTQYYFIDSMKNKLCFENCPKSYVVFNQNQCLVRCPENYKAMNSICVVINKTTQTVMYIVVGAVMVIMALTIVIMERRNKMRIAAEKLKKKKNKKSKEIELGQSKKVQIKINISGQVSAPQNTKDSYTGIKPILRQLQEQGNKDVQKKVKKPVMKVQTNSASNQKMKMVHKHSHGIL